MEFFGLGFLIVVALICLIVLAADNKRGNF